MNEHINSRLPILPSSHLHSPVSCEEETQLEQDSALIASLAFVLSCYTLLHHSTSYSTITILNCIGYWDCLLKAVNFEMGFLRIFFLDHLEFNAEVVSIQFLF